MKNKLMIMTAAVAAIVSFTASVQAVPITGSITFAGGATLNTGSAGTATAVTSWTGPGGVGQPFVLVSTLSAGPVAAFSPVTFAAGNWNFASGPVAAFWQVGGYTFNLISSAISGQGGSPASVTVTGIGKITKAGFEDTLGTWAFSTQDPGAGAPLNFSFSAAVGSVPDGGMTVMLLGAALSGLFVFRKKVMA